MKIIFRKKDKNKESGNVLVRWVFWFGLKKNFFGINYLGNSWKSRQDKAEKYKNSETFLKNSQSF